MTNPWDIPGINERLIELYKQGLFFSEIAEGLNAEYDTQLTRDACIGRANQMELPERPPQPSRPKMPPIVCDPVPIVELDTSNCHYPLGGMLDRPPYLYCGMPALEGFSWCAMHYRKVYVPTRSRFA
jgi:GcrA cell cycle regulator